MGRGGEMETRRWGEGEKEGRGARDFRFSIPTSFVGAGQVFGLRIADLYSRRSEGTQNAERKTLNKVLSSNIFAHPYRCIRLVLIHCLPREDVPP